MPDLLTAHDIASRLNCSLYLARNMMDKMDKVQIAGGTVRPRYAVTLESYERFVSGNPVKHVTPRNEPIRKKEYR